MDEFEKWLQEDIEFLNETRIESKRPDNILHLTIEINKALEILEQYRELKLTKESK